METCFPGCNNAVHIDGENSGSILLPGEDAFERAVGKRPRNILPNCFTILIPNLCCDILVRHRVKPIGKPARYHNSIVGRTTAVTLSLGLKNSRMKTARMKRKAMERETRITCFRLILTAVSCSAPEPPARVLLYPRLA
ncbi:MAG: hypothetical protein N3F08_04915 [Crenarchaeota archaeon]|nr:hypothetical protein [Thermoproteota archaeon]